MIEVINCTKCYGELIAVNNISFRADDSKISGFLGPNGAGKSTTIKMMVGLLKPDSGTIKIKGYDIEKEPIEAKKILAYVPEKAFLYERLTGWEYLNFISGLYRLERDLFIENATYYLNTFKLYEWKDELIGNYSMGMKQRLLLTSVFMRNPDVIIMDEPHNGLDPKGVRLLKEILFRLKEEGKTILLSTHILAIAEEICDEVAIINAGTIVAQGNKDDLKRFSSSRDKTLEDIFLRLTEDYRTGVKAE